MRWHHVEGHRIGVARPARECSAASAKPSHTIDEMTGNRPRSSSATMRVTVTRSAAVSENTSPVVAVGHHCDDTGVPSEPRGELSQRRFIDPEVRGERAGDGRDDSAIVPDGRHGGAPLQLPGKRHDHPGGDAGPILRIASDYSNRAPGAARQPTARSRSGSKISWRSRRAATSPVRPRRAPVAQPAFSRHYPRARGMGRRRPGRPRAHPVDADRWRRPQVPAARPRRRDEPRGGEDQGAARAGWACAASLVAFAVTHALSITFFPRWLRRARDWLRPGPIQTLADHCAPAKT